MERRTTLAAMIVGIGVATLIGVVGMAQTGNIAWLFLSLPFTVVLFVMAQFAPRGYRITPEGLRIERTLRDRVIPWRDVRGVDDEARQLTGISVTASRGIFGWFGWFWSVRFGLYQLFVTDRRRIVWLRTERGLVGVSPDRPEEFVARVRERSAG